MMSSDTHASIFLGIPVECLRSNGFIYSGDIEVFCNRRRLQKNKKFLPANQFFGLPSVKVALLEMQELLTFTPVNFIRGKGKGRYIHPYVAVAMILWLDSSFLSTVRQWFANELQHDYTNTQITENLVDAEYGNPIELPLLLIKVRKRLRLLCGITSDNVDAWELADTKQIELRNRINDVFKILSTVLNPIVALDRAVEIVSDEYPQILKHKIPQCLTANQPYSVYFISDGTHTKIGIAKNVAFRLKALQTSNPKTLYVYNTIPCDTKSHAVKLERKLHDKLREHRSTALNEWFNILPEYAFTHVHQEDVSNKDIKINTPPKKLLKKVSK